MHHEEKAILPWWVATKAGILLGRSEKEALDRVLPRMYGYHLVQYGLSEFGSFVSSSLISHRVLMNEEGRSGYPNSVIKGSAEAMPIQNDSVDVVVLTHTLEEASAPHQIIREVHRVLIAEGHVVITGINPLSCWGLVTAVKNLFTNKRHTKMISPNRIKDWLKLMNFEITDSVMFCYRPPISNFNFMSKIEFLEKLGTRFWPFLGGAYMIVGIKRMVTLTPVKAKFRVSSKIWGAEGVPGGANYKRDVS